MWAVLRLAICSGTGWESFGFGARGFLTQVFGSRFRAVWLYLSTMTQRRHRRVVKICRTRFRAQGTKVWLLVHTVQHYFQCSVCGLGFLGVITALCTMFWKHRYVHCHQHHMRPPLFMHAQTGTWNPKPLTPKSLMWPERPIPF